MVSLRPPPKMPRGVVFSLVCCLILNKDQVNGFTVTHDALKTRQTLSRAQPTALFSQEPRRQPRRNLKKRRTRRERKGSDGEDFPWETAESRPLVLSSAIEAGEDYWIDEKDLEEAKKREEAMKNRKAMEGEIPREKLWEETLAPYRQNWIGYFSVVIVILATIVTQFPELLDPPTPQIPDL